MALPKEPLQLLTELHYDPARGDDGVICLHVNGRVFLALGETVRHYALPTDETALPAFNRAFVCNPDLFRPLTKRAAVVQTEAGFSKDLTVEDRARLHSIIEKHYRFYFADHPTAAQMDNLIDGLGLEVARRIVENAVKAGQVS